MQHQPPRHPSPARSAPVLSPTADRAHWTPTRQRTFLRELMETGSIARAAAAAGMSRSSAHRLRQRLAGTPFDRSWEGALAVFRARLLDPYSVDASARLSGDEFDAD